MMNDKTKEALEAARAVLHRNVQRLSYTDPFIGITYAPVSAYGTELRAALAKIDAALAEQPAVSEVLKEAVAERDQGRRQAMNNRELLEKAAKAAGMRLTTNGVRDLGQWEWLQAGDHKWGLYANNANGTQRCWNPLLDDGDALRLAVDLRMKINCSKSDARTTAYIEGAVQGYAHDFMDDPQAATRRAIVHAAVEAYEELLDASIAESAAVADKP